MHIRAHEYIDFKTGVKYCLKVNSDKKLDWEIQVFDRNGNFKETLNPPSAFNYIPSQIRKTMRLDLMRFQKNIAAG